MVVTNCSFQMLLWGVIVSVRSWKLWSEWCVLLCKMICIDQTMLLFITVHVRSLLGCFSYLHIFLCVSLILVILSLLTNFHKIWYEQHSTKRPPCHYFLYFPSINNTNSIQNKVYMSTETCEKCDTFRLCHTSLTYLEFLLV